LQGQRELGLELFRHPPSTADRQASTGCASGPATEAGHQEAIVRFTDKLIIIGACHATRETDASEGIPAARPARTSKSIPLVGEERRMV
jgi:hypothetical protein